MQNKIYSEHRTKSEKIIGIFRMRNEQKNYFRVLVTTLVHGMAYWEYRNLEESYESQLCMGYQVKYVL
jgi:hypothetical protein